MDSDLLLTLVSLGAALLGVVLVGFGIWERRRTAARLERDAPDGSAAARARHAAFSASVALAPPGMVAVYDQRERDAWRQTQPVRAEALSNTAAAIDRADSRERALRATLAADLRAGLWREVLGAVLVVVGVAASTLAALV